MSKTTQSNRALIKRELDRAQEQLEKWTTKHINTAASVVLEFITTAQENGYEPSEEHIYITNQMANILQGIEMLIKVIEDLNKTI